MNSPGSVAWVVCGFGWAFVALWLAGTLPPHRTDVLMYWCFVGMPIVLGLGWLLPAILG